MNNKDTKETNVLAQASILMVAGIITRIIGVLYRSPLTRVIGDEGNGYYGIAVNIYTMILLVSSYSIPMAVSKVVSSKLAVHQYRIAHKVFKCALMYVLVIGGLVTVCCAGSASADPDASTLIGVLPVNVLASGAEDTLPAADGHDRDQSGQRTGRRRLSCGAVAASGIDPRGGGRRGGGAHRQSGRRSADRHAGRGRLDGL